MISLSEEWSLLSKVMYGKEFIDELSLFLKKQNIKTILECGCGDGNVLHGLAKNGFKGIGIDGDKYLINEARKNNSHKNIEYKFGNWMGIDKIKENFDAVICRGNSLSYAISWDKKSFNQVLAKEQIEKSLYLFLDKLKEGGLLYIDTIPKREIENNGGGVSIKMGDINLNGKITHNWGKRLRFIGGSGTLGGKYFKGGSSSYLMKPIELEEMIKSFNPSKVWNLKLKYEINYDVICARK